ncbi:MAG: hemerythrin domain-containing protein [Sulfuricaulis sp.]|nr:hemerythrin domain-containing protein [Sulfuricaulis sp.]
MATIPVYSVPSVTAGLPTPAVKHRPFKALNPVFIMTSIKDFMTVDHRHCDDFFAESEQAVAAQAWDRAGAAFGSFQAAMQHHFAAEEELLFPAFELKSGMTMGPTQVMRVEHAQMRELMAAAQASLLAKDADDYAGNAETLLIMMQQHNMKEEQVLYPMCDEQLKDQMATLLLQLQQAL